MAAYHKVEVSLNTNAVEVGIPSPQSVTVTVPTVGPVGPQGPAGPKGDPGEVSGSIAWDNVTDKPSTFTPSSHTHHGNEVYLGVSGDDAPALLSGFSDTSINGVYWPQDFLINGFYVYKKNKQYGLFNENQTWHVFENVPITANIVESSDNDGADLPWVAAAWNGSVSRAAVSDFGVNAAQQFVFVGDNIPSTQVTGLSIPTASSATPQALGVAAAGTSSDFARADHVHAMPSAADVGAAAATHASTHHTGGTDALAAHQINGQTIFGTGTPTYSTDQTLGAARALQLTVSNTNASGINLTLPAQSDGTLNGDTYVVIGGGTLSGPITVRRINLLSPLIYQTLATITATGQQYRFRASGGQTGGWTLVPVDTHSHPSTQITGLGTAAAQDSTAFAPATGISPSAITGTAVVDNDARLSDARTPLSHTHGNLTNDGKLGTTAGLPLKTGTAGAIEAGAFGTGAGEFAEGNHTHTQLHDRSHAITSTSDHTAGNHKVFYSNGSGEIVELALGNSGEVLTSNGATSAPSFAAAAAGGTKTYAVFTATDNQPPASNYATLDTRNSIAVLDFDDATDESAVFVSIIPEGASLGSGLKIRLHWMATTATSGDVVWDVSLERMNTDLDSDSFDTIASGTAAANGTSGILTVTEITLTTIDSVTAGDGFRLKVTRDATNGSDDLSGDAELVVCEVRSAA